MTAIQRRFSILGLVVAGGTAACIFDNGGDYQGGGRRDDGAKISSQPAPGTDSGSGGDDCPSAAKAVCTKAAQCSNNVPPLKIRLLVGPLSYDSEASCEEAFTKKCGPSSPASDVPHVEDPAACVSAMATASCDGDTLPLPAACGG